jgi:hypothetical protein
MAMSIRRVRLVAEVETPGPERHGLKVCVVRSNHRTCGQVGKIGFRNVVGSFLCSIHKIAFYPCRRRAKSWNRVALALNRLLYARMGDVVVVADFTKRISAALQLTVGANRCSAVTALGDGRFAARHSIVAVAGLLGAQDTVYHFGDCSVLLSIRQVVAASSSGKGY